MARAQFWDQFNLSSVVLNDLWQAAQSRDSYIDEPPFTFGGRTYDDALVLYREDAEGTKWWFEQYGSDIVTDANGVVTSGTINAIANWFNDPGETEHYYDSYIDRFSVDAKAFTDALISTDTADDLLIFQQMFRKADTIRLAGYDDDFFGWTGNDTISGGGGSDTISGDGGHDSLSGESGRDVLMGGAGNDILIGGKGADSLTGGAGLDQFVFDSSSGRDIVTDFRDGTDRIVIVSGAESFAELTVSRTDLGVSVTFGTVQITLLNERLSAITAADFDFI